MNSLLLQKESHTTIEILKHSYYEHKLALYLGFQRLARQKFQSIGSILLIGLNVFLVIVFSFLSAHLMQGEAYLKQSPTVTIFPKTTLTQKEQLTLTSRLNQHPGLQNLKLLNAQEIVSGLLDHKMPATLLDSIPGLITAQLSPDIQITSIKSVEKELLRDKAIASVEFDSQWQQQLNILLNLSQFFTWGIGSILLASIILMIDYSVRLFMERYRPEIATLYTLGAHAGFIRRPYLYQAILLAVGACFVGGLALFVVYALLGQDLKLLSRFMGLGIMPSMAFDRVVQVMIAVILLALLSAYHATSKWLHSFDQKGL